MGGGGWGVVLGDVGGGRGRWGGDGEGDGEGEGREMMGMGRTMADWLAGRGGGEIIASGPSTLRRYACECYRYMFSSICFA